MTFPVSIGAEIAKISMISTLLVYISDFINILLQTLLNNLLTKVNSISDYHSNRVILF